MIGRHKVTDSALPDNLQTADRHNLAISVTFQSLPVMAGVGLGNSSGWNTVSLGAGPQNSSSLQRAATRS